MDAQAQLVREYLLGLQDRICAGLEGQESDYARLRLAARAEALASPARFSEQRLAGEGGGLARPRVLAGGAVIEKSAVHFTHSVGRNLPPAATERRPELAGRGFEAVSLSLIVHPRNPYAPTTHMNLRFFTAESVSREGKGEAVWWFGGGFDLTPSYGFEEDALHWHRTAREACRPHGADLYARFKKTCDEYFYLPHRGETRGVGGLFFDDLVHGDFARSFALVQSVGDHFLPAYLPILERRKVAPFGERERDFQLVRRGRYAEFNLVYDRGTKYGLQSGRRVESVLASLPPLAAWRYDWQPEPGTPEARLSTEFLVPRDWLAGE
jgi:coproporphyrinogen III oxidase